MGEEPSHKRESEPIPSGTDFKTIYEKYAGTLRPGSGDNYIGYCPIHGETPGVSKPSLSVNVANGLWNCFAGCGGGNLASFLKALECPPEMIRAEVRRAPKSVIRIKKRTSTETVRLPEKLLGVFDYCPMELIDSGFDPEVLESNDVGYDQNRRRIVYPVRDISGNLVGLVGRNSTTRGGKYKVYTNELTEYGIQNYGFRKGDYLWRGDKVKTLLRKTRGPLYVVEGFKAALWLVQSGIEQVVALMGSSMSESQKKSMLSMGPKKIVLVLDGDTAGRRASRKIADQLTGLVRTEIVSLGNSQQPDDLPLEEIYKLCTSIRNRRLNSNV